MKKILLILLAALFLFAACNASVGGTADDSGNSGTGGDDQPTVVEYNSNYNMALNGGFEAFEENKKVDGLNWGATDNVTVVTEDDSKVAKMASAEGLAFMYYQTIHDITLADAKLSARIKLTNTADASKVSLVLEFVDNNGNDVIANASFSSKPEATEGWQTVEVALTVEQMKNIAPYKTTMKVVVEEGAEPVFVDDMQLLTSDVTKVNFLGFSNFNGTNLDGKYQIVIDGAWSTPVPVEGGKDGDSDKAVEMASGNELFTASQWFSGGNLSILYPTDKAGELSIYAKGDGAFSVLVERKNSDSDVDTTAATTFEITDEWKEYTLEIPASKVYSEVTIKIYNYTGSGKLLIDSPFLHLTED